MKKIMKLFVYVAAAAMALASCQKNEMDAPVKKNVHFTIKAGIETKTSIEETPAGDKTIYTPKWDGNEELGVLFTAPNGNTNPDDVVKLVNNESGHLANFEGEVEIEGESGTFYSFYPAKAFKKGYTEGDVRLDLSNVQKPKATSFDPECDILVAKPQDYVVEEGVVTVQNLEFARIMSVLRIDLKSECQDLKNEFVKSISFTAGDIEITGYARIKLDNPEFTGNWASSGNQYCTVTANYDTDIVSINGASNSVYLVIAPVTIPAGKDLTFEIRTKNYSLTKKITSPEMKFTAGNVSKINLSISSENIDKSDDYSGEYLIAGKDGNKWYAAQKYSSGNYLKVSEIEFEGENILETENIADYYMTIDKVVGGEYNGMYTIVDAGGKYLSTSSSSSNDMKAVDVASANTYWTIKKDDDNGTYSIVASMSENRNDMRFNYNNGNPRVSCYDGTKTNLPYLTLFSTSLVKPDTTPKIIVEEGTERTIGADGGDLTFTCVLKNLDGQTLSVDESEEELTASVSGKVVTITVAANTTANQKELNATIKCGSVELPVTITQAGKPAGGGEADVEVWSWTGGGKSAFDEDPNVVEIKGLGSDYAASNAPYLIKLDTTGDYFIVKVDGAIQSVSVGVKMFGGSSTSYLDFQGSSDGSSYSSVQKHTISGKQNDILELTTSNTFDASYRYIKFNFTKGSNVGVGPITITYIPDNEGGSDGEEPKEPVQLVMEDVTCTAQTENSLTFTWDDVANATAYEVTCNNKTETVNTTTYTATDLSAGTEYEISVKAVGDGTNYTTSEPKTAKGTTKAAEQGGGETPETKTWKLVTSASTLKAGDKLAIVSTSKGKIASATISDKVMGEISVSIANNSFVSLPSGAAELTLGGSSESWTLTNASGKKLGATAVKKVAWDSGTTTWTITIAANGDATIQNTTSSYGRFLYNVSSPRFTTYTSNANATMLLPQIYRYE